MHFGRSDVPVCWTICRLTSGYISRSDGKEIYVLEDRCMGKGDAACHLFGRTREEWGNERGEELRFFESKRLKEGLDVSLDRVTETLKAAERKLREHRRALVRVARDVEEPLGIIAKSPTMRSGVAASGLERGPWQDPAGTANPARAAIARFVDAGSINYAHKPARVAQSLNDARQPGQSSRAWYRFLRRSGAELGITKKDRERGGWKGTSPRNDDSGPPFFWNGFLLQRDSFARVRPLPNFACSARTTDSDDRERKGGEDRAPVSSVANA